MKRLVAIPLAVFAVLAATALFAPVAMAHPAYASVCSDCHGGANVAVTATKKSETASAVTYTLSAPTATAIGVFNGATKVTAITATTGTLSIPRGKTYRILAVKGPGTSDGLGSITVKAPATSASTSVATKTTIAGPSSVKVKTTLALTGTVRTATAAAPGTVTILKTRLIGGLWKSQGSAVVTVTSGKFAYSFKPTVKGSWRFQAVYAGKTVGTTVCAASRSAVKGVTVK